MGFIPQGVPFTALPTALRGKLQPNQLAVLWVIQTYAGANYESWPSLTTIADGACVSVRTARGVIGQLESLGFLERQFRVDERGNQSSNLYRVTVVHLANVENPGGVTPAPFAATPAAAAPLPGRICRPPRQELPPN